MVDKERILKEVNDLKDFMIETGNYKYPTIKSYSAAYRQLLYFVPHKKGGDISNEDVNKFIDNLVIYKKLARASVLSNIHALKTIYNKFQGKKYDIRAIKLPPAIFNKPDYIKQNDILGFIYSIENKKHKAIIALMYSCGLSHSELLPLKITDVESNLNRIVIRDEFGKVKRMAYLSKSMLKMLREYYVDQNPKKYLFEGQNGGMYSRRSIQTFFKKLAHEYGLHNDTTPFDLRQSYIKHMVMTGTPITYVLQNLGIQTFDSHIKYTRYIYGDSSIDYSPLDKLVLNLENRDEDIDKLEFTIKTIGNVDEKEYLLEGLQCLSNGANRAAVVMIWNACIRRIQRKLISDFSLKNLNSELHKIYQKSKPVKTIDDFQYVKEANVVQLAANLGMFDKFEKNILIQNCLGLRNKCGHPTKYRPDLIRVTSFIEDIISICFVKT